MRLGMLSGRVVWQRRLGLLPWLDPAITCELKNHFFIIGGQRNPVIREERNPKHESIQSFY